MKKSIALALAVIMPLCLLAGCRKDGDDTQESATESTSSNIIIENITDENGENVTNEDGEPETQVYEEIPVLDEKGNQVLDEKGEPVTKKVPATLPSNGSNKGQENGSSSNGNTNNNTSSSTKKPESSSSTTKEPATPTKPSPPTEPPTTPTNPPPTEPPIEPPTKPTEPPAKVYDIDYFVNYAKSYGQSIGLILDTAGSPDNGSWDTPISGNFPVGENDTSSFGENILQYIKNDIEHSCRRLKREGNTYFWVYASSNDFDGNPMKPGRYYLYIGY